MKTTIDMAREANLAKYGDGLREGVAAFINALERFEALARADERSLERERICKAIKEEDDYCVTEGDYMLDSNDCIAVANGVWVRPEFNPEPIRVRGNT